jgi:hypothetical protein
MPDRNRNIPIGNSSSPVRQVRTENPRFETTQCARLWRITQYPLSSIALNEAEVDLA